MSCSTMNKIIMSWLLGQLLLVTLAAQEMQLHCLQTTLGLYQPMEEFAGGQSHDSDRTAFATLVSAPYYGIRAPGGVACTAKK